jgi:hypothetical protein
MACPGHAGLFCRHNLNRDTWLRINAFSRAKRTFAVAGGSKMVVCARVPVQWNIHPRHSFNQVCRT